LNFVALFHISEIMSQAALQR